MYIDFLVEDYPSIIDFYMAELLYKPPIKHNTFVYHLYNVGPPSWTVVQHCINEMHMFCAYWVINSQAILLVFCKLWSSKYKCIP